MISPKQSPLVSPFNGALLVKRKIMCYCKPNMTDVERYAQQVVIIPPIKQVVDRRTKAGLNPAVCVDPCILEEIILLWEAGIITHGCCCGHNDPRWYSFVNVDEKSIEQMLAMGYVQYHEDPTRRDTFRLKSA